MIQKFKKNPVIIEAVQWNNLNHEEISLFIQKEIKPELESETAYLAGKGAPIFSISIETKEGVMKAFPNDWIIKEPFPTGDRDFYPCKPDIFEKTYSPVEETPDPVFSLEDMKNAWNFFRYKPFPHGETDGYEFKDYMKEKHNIDINQ